MDNKLLRNTAVAALVLIMSACTTVQPFPVPAANPPLASVRDNLTAHQNQHVVWGGTILSIDVKQTQSLVSILAKPLDNNGQPIQSDKSDGRFLARFSGFRDPAVFAVGRSLTIAGTVQGGETLKIGEYDYLYPVVEVADYRLWSIPVTRSYDDYDHWWYDPWYPWYPWYPGYYPSYRYLPQKLPPTK